jgi:hypothetical protein
MPSYRKKLKAKPDKKTKIRDSDMAKIKKYLSGIKFPRKITKAQMLELAISFEKEEKKSKSKRKSPKKSKSKRKSPKKSKSKRKSNNVGIQIGKLMKKGYPHKQAVAIALSMKKSNKLGPRGGYKKSKSKRKSPKKV